MSGHNNPIEQQLYQAEYRHKKRRERLLKPCGTPAAYERHRRKKEPIDDLCRRAHNKRCREVMERKRGQINEFHELKSARAVALERMAVRYPDLFLPLYNEALRELKKRPKDQEKK